MRDTRDIARESSDFVSDPRDPGYDPRDIRDTLTLDHQSQNPRKLRGTTKNTAESLGGVDRSLGGRNLSIPA